MLSQFTLRALIDTVIRKQPALFWYSVVSYKLMCVFSFAFTIYMARYTFQKAK